jgi:transposase
MGQIWEKHIHDKLVELDKVILPKYREESKKRIEEQKIDYGLYEKEFKRRIKKAIRVLTPITNEATSGLVFYREKGVRPMLKPNEKLRLILIHQLFGKSNRNMSYMLTLFSLMTGIDVSYKTVERLYSDPETEAALFNLLILLLKKKKIKEIDCCGDATGYSLFISKHYLTEVNKLKDEVKEQDPKDDKKAFVYKFALMDMSTRMYVCYGTSFISEKRAFNKAMEMLSLLDISIKSIRLDRYYSNPSDVKRFPDSKVYIIPKINAGLGHGDEWLNMMKEFVEKTWNFLEEYFQRVNIENAWAQDKKVLGWKVSQKRLDRIDTALFCRSIWHDLFYLD